MATGHMLTNKGRLLLLQGIWDDAGATAIKVGLVQAQPAAADTAVEIAVMNTVYDLLVTAAATECTFTNYARKDLTRAAVAEDDTNHRVNLDAADVTWTSAGGTTNNTIYGAFFYDATTDTSDSTRLLISVDWFATTMPTNGGNITYSIADLFRVA